MWNMWKRKILNVGVLLVLLGLLIWLIYHCPSIKCNWCEWKNKIIIGGVFLGLLVLILLLDLCSSKKWLIKSSRGVLYYITSQPIFSIFICYVIICVLLVVELYITPLNLNEDSILLVCLSIIGFVGTIIGLIATYIQLKHNNNQFYGYSDFYRIAEEMLTQKGRRRTIKFHFSTPIPGHIAYPIKSDFQSFLEQLKNYKGNIEFIIPSEVMIKKMYDQYRNKTIDATTYTEILINNKLSSRSSHKELTVERFIETLRGNNETRRVNKHNVKVYVYKAADESEEGFRENESKKPEVIENLYLSDGRVAVYAIPLHFLNIQDGASKEIDTKPVLIGFVTTDRNLVNTLDNNFNRVRDDSKRCTLLDDDTHYLEFRDFQEQQQLCILNNMYSKYIKNPDYHETELNQIQDIQGTPEWPAKVLELSQDNFDGMVSTNEIVNLLDINPSDKVLDIGSGFGGVSLAIAMKMKDSITEVGKKKRITGIEIQKPRCDFANELAKKLKVNDIVDFKCSDFLNAKLPKEQYSKIVSVLSILHFIDKESALKKIGTLLAPGGILVIDDYYSETENLSEVDQEALRKTISIPSLLTKEKYLNALENSGIIIKEVKDKTKDWKELCKKRVDDVVNGKDDLVRIWGEDKANNHIEFCKGVSDLYENGVVHGFRIIGTKKNK